MLLVSNFFHLHKIFYRLEESNYFLLFANINPCFSFTTASCFLPISSSLACFCPLSFRWSETIELNWFSSRIISAWALAILIYPVIFLRKCGQFYGFTHIVSEIFIEVVNQELYKLCYIFCPLYFLLWLFQYSSQYS